MADKGDPNPSTTAIGGGGATSSSASASTAAMLNQPIVIDCGSSSMKAGFAGGTKPKVCLVATVAVPNANDEIDDYNMPSSFFLTFSFNEYRHLNSRYPLEPKLGAPSTNASCQVAPSRGKSSTSSGAVLVQANLLAVDPSPPPPVASPRTLWDEH
jgi:hypothetical protein